MKRLLSSLILVLVLVPLVLLMRWGGEAKGPWSEPRDGVQARLVASRFLWRADGSVDVALRLRNRTPSPRDVLPLSVTIRILHEGSIAGEETITIAAAALPPGGIIDLPLRSGRLDLAGPGLYSVDGTLDGIGLPAVKIRLLKSRR